MSIALSENLQTGFVASRPNIRVGVQHKLQVGMCVQRHLKSVCESIKSDFSLSFRLKNLGP